MRRFARSALACSLVAYVALGLSNAQALVTAETNGVGNTSDVPLVLPNELLRIGIFVAGVDRTYVQDMAKEAESIESRSEYEIEIFDAGDSATLQRAQLRDALVNRNFNAWYVVPVDHARLCDVLADEVTAAGILAMTSVTATCAGVGLRSEPESFPIYFDSDAHGILDELWRRSLEIAKNPALAEVPSRWVAIGNPDLLDEVLEGLKTFGPPQIRRAATRAEALLISDSTDDEPDRAEVYTKAELVAYFQNVTVGDLVVLSSPEAAPITVSALESAGRDGLPGDDPASGGGDEPGPPIAGQERPSTSLTPAELVRGAIDALIHSWETAFDTRARIPESDFPFHEGHSL